MFSLSAMLMRLPGNAAMYDFCIDAESGLSGPHPGRRVIRKACLAMPQRKLPSNRVATVERPHRQFPAGSESTANSLPDRSCRTLVAANLLFPAAASRLDALAPHALQERLILSAASCSNRRTLRLVQTGPYVEKEQP